MAQTGGGLGLPLGTGCRLPLAGHDLERDVEPVLLVPGEPDRDGTSAPERPKRAVASEDELAMDKGWDSVGHRLYGVGEDENKSFTRSVRANHGLEEMSYWMGLSQ